MIELSGFSRSIVASVIRVVGAKRAMLSIVLVCALLTYGGVSLFVVVFAVYPFAAEMFRQGNIPKRLIPGTIALGAFSFTMDSLPGTPQIQNIIPTTFFHTTSWAAPWLGTIGALFIIVVGMSYLEWRRRVALRYGQGYDHGLTKLVNEPETAETGTLAHPLVALSPLVLVGVMNLLFTRWIPTWYGKVVTVALPGLPKPLTVEADKLTAIWAVEAALLIGIIVVLGIWLPRGEGPLCGRQQGGRVGRLAGRDEHRFGIRFRWRDRRASGFPGAGRWPARDSESARQ